MWSTTLAHSGLSYRAFSDRVTDLELTSDQGFLLGGPATWYSQSVTGTNYRLVKFNRMGHKQWTKEFVGTSSEDINSSRSLGCVKVNGSELIVGGTYIARNEKATEGLAKGKSDFYLSKVALPAKRWKIKQRK